ncbi:MAG TPA: hypothetical protein ENF69_07525 [Euryarchaeota archaeon]|nr:hypothetical protein [Euryarchaeota archaeon]
MRFRMWRIWWGLPETTPHRGRQHGNQVHGDLHRWPLGITTDHHLPRVLEYRDFLKEALAGVKVKTAAEWMGVEERLLEARRRELHASVMEG